MSLASKDLKKRLIKVIIWVVASGVVLSLTILTILLTAGISFFAISGSSMEPTLNDRDVIILKKDKGIAKDQIFVFDKPESWGYMGDKTPILIKRVVATPGDTLSYNGEAFSVNGEEIYNTKVEGYECSAGDTEYEHELTQSEVFVMGDNAKVSLDSRRIFCDGDSDSIFIKKRDRVDNGYIQMQF